MAVEGQTTASVPQNEHRALPKVRQKEGTTWKSMLWEGGMIRSKSGQWYLDMPGGIGDLIVMNFVDGYSFGPHAIFGHMRKDRSRWEIEETVRYASGRQTWMGKGSLRWFGPVEMGTMVELYGGQHTEDFDHDPVMPMSQSLLATGIFGWNHYKLQEKTDAGLRFAFPLSNDLDLKARAGWERRRKMMNHRETNVFGAHGQSNIPRISDGHSDLLLFDDPVDGQLALLGLELNYQPHRRHMVYDDMTCVASSRWPLFTLKADAGLGDWHYLSLDLHVSQDIRLPRRNDQIRYFVSGGDILHKDDLGLADWHHFDASRFWWQQSSQLTHFALLDNYEYSTSERWAEAHVEWNSDQMLLSQLTRNGELLKEYIQLHTVAVPDLPFHWEWQYGIDFAQAWRMGVALAWNEFDFQGAAFTMALNLNAGREMRKKAGMTR